MSSSFFPKNLRVNLLPAITVKSTFFLAVTLLLNLIFFCLNANATPYSDAQRKMQNATRNFSINFQNNQRNKRIENFRKQIDDIGKPLVPAGVMFGGYGLIKQNENPNEREY
jgi:hypothetical protein